MGEQERLEDEIRQVLDLAHPEIIVQRPTEEWYRQRDYPELTRVLESDGSPRPIHRGRLIAMVASGFAVVLLGALAFGWRGTLYGAVATLVAAIVTNLPDRPGFYSDLWRRTLLETGGER